MPKLNFRNYIQYLLHVFWVLSIIFLGYYYHKSDKQSLPINIPYSEARDIILRSGWSPVLNNSLDDEIGFHAAYLRNKGYIEVDDCSGTGMGYCIFLFQNQESVFLIVTTQEVALGNSDVSLRDKDDAVVINYSIKNTIH